MIIYVKLDTLKNTLETVTYKLFDFTFVLNGTFKEEKAKIFIKLQINSKDFRKNGKEKNGKVNIYDKNKN